MLTRNVGYLIIKIYLINKLIIFRNEIIFCNFKNGAMMHPPSRRRDTSRQRERSLPRSSDKLKQDLLSLITEPVPNVSQTFAQSVLPTSPTGQNISMNISGKTDSTDDDLSPRKFNHEHLTEADRQFTPMVNHNLISHPGSHSVQINRSKRSKSSSNDPITEDRLHRIEKTLREMQIKLDEVSIQQSAI
jgi:hypothetical protein